MRLNPGFLVAALMAGTAVQPLRAQVIRGQVVDGTSGSPVSTGFVILRSAEGTELRRTLTTREGRFTIQPPGPGVYRLRSERIGYEAWDSPTIRLAPRDTIDFLLRVTALPIILSTITVEEDTPCQIRASEGVNTAVVWEEVRKALVAASWSAAQGFFRHELHWYRRTLDRSRRRVSKEEVSLSSGYYTSPYSSRSPDSLLLQGYVVDRNGGEWRWYYAPDANVLLDDSFQSTHCFTIVREERDRVPHVGLAFAPIPNRKRSDVEGTLWLQEETSALSRLEFRFTGMEDVPEDDRIGGTVEFLAMPSGAWIVHRWQIRTPRLAPRETRGLFVTRTRLELRGFNDVGGEIVRIHSQDGSTMYTSPNVARVSGMVFDSTRRRPLGGATISITGTPYTGITARNGTFDIPALLDGEYGVAFSHPWADSLGYLPEQYYATLSPGDSIFMQMALPSVEGIVRRRCTGSTGSPSTRVLVGTVRGANGRPVGRGVEVAVTWQRVSVSQSAGPLSIRDWGERVFTDEEGRYIACGLPLDRPISIVVEAGNGGKVTARVLFRPGIVEVAEAPGDVSPFTAYGWEERIWPLDLHITAAPRTVAFRGEVRDITTRELLQAVPIVLNGVAVAVTDDEGQFNVYISLIENQPSRISIRHPGYQPFEREVTLERDQDEIRLTLPLRPTG